MRPEDLQDLSLLGQKSVPYIFEYTPDVLEAFPNRHPENDYFVKFNAPEFTSLCPITNQPDFATIFRNHGDFHENCINVIGKDLVKLMDPRYLEVWGKFTPRGGISIDPYYNYGKPGTKYEKMAEHRLFNHDLYPETVDNR